MVTTQPTMSWSYWEWPLVYSLCLKRVVNHLLDDNAYAIGWIYKTGKLPRTPIYHQPAKFIARSRFSPAAKYLIGTSFMRDLRECRRDPQSGSPTKRPFFLTDSHQRQNTSSGPASSVTYESADGTPRVDLLQSVRRKWLRQLCAMPSMLWVQHTGQVVGGASRKSAMGTPIPVKPLNQGYGNSSERLKRWILPQIDNRHYSRVPDLGNRESLKHTSTLIAAM